MLFRHLFVAAVGVQVTLLLIYLHLLSNHDVFQNLGIPHTPVRQEAYSIRPSDAVIDEFEEKLPKLIFRGKKEICRQKRCLVFMHIAKAGGSSFEKLGRNFSIELNRTFEGMRHFDWSYIQALGDTEHSDVMVLLREPVARAVSHYFYIQTQPWGKVVLGNNGTSLEKYMHNKTQLLDSRDVWQDGQAAVSWLSGTHIGRWTGVPKGQIARREQYAAENVTLLLHLSADRLERTMWFGILGSNYLNRSMELLQHALKLDYRPVLPTQNVNKGKLKHGKPTPAELDALASLMPQDLWLYEHAVHLFEARWAAYQTGKPVQVPRRPPLPELPCISTRFNLTCKSGPLKGRF